jgi:hypothetical protein
MVQKNFRAFGRAICLVAQNICWHNKKRQLPFPGTAAFVFYVYTIEPINDPTV